MSDLRRLQLGQVVDFCIAYNERAEKAEKEEKAEKQKKRPKRHKATPEEIKAYFG